MATSAARTTANRDYYNLRACPKCSRIYQAAVHIPNDAVCPKCKEENDAEERKSRRSAPRGAPCKYITVVADPTGDFQPGRRFETQDWRVSLSAGAWPVGAVFITEQGDTLTVAEPGVVIFRNVEMVVVNGTQLVRRWPRWKLRE